MMRSNSKLPFSVTGEKGSSAVRLRYEFEAVCDVVFGIGMLDDFDVAGVVDVATARCGLGDVSFMMWCGMSMCGLRARMFNWCYRATVLEVVVNGESESARSIARWVVEGM
jgi:hypothetical protein